MKLANTRIVFNNSSGVMMTLFKTRVNRGNRDIKYDLCIKKAYLKSKK